MIENRIFDREFEILKVNVKNLLGFNTFQYKNSFLSRRFDARLRIYNLDTYGEYLKLLKRDKIEQEKLLKDLTINVTEFFRDYPVFEVFQNDVIPKVLKQKQKIRIWSAGCSDGKETYSIAMIMARALDSHHIKNRIEILGTDIDRDCLQKAAFGVYESRPGLPQTNIEKQLRFVGDSEKYFKIKDNTYEVKPFLKEPICFQYHDLISGRKKRNFDIIFCRNVVIYFTRDLQETLYKDFYNALNSDGYLIMGKTETIVGETRELFTSLNSKERILIKQ